MDLLKLGASTLNNVQLALSTTGNNISNANTVGYSRQTVNFVTNQSSQYGFGSLGNGASVSSIGRSSSSFMTTQVQNFTASSSRSGIYLQYSTQLDNLLGDASNSISNSLQQFFNGVQGVSANPAGMPERQVMLNSANDLVQKVQSVNNSLDNINQQIDSQLKTSVDTINGLSDSIRQLNLQIVSASASSTTQAPNDLLDQRDVLLSKLAQQVGINVVPQSDGSVNVFAGKGQPLVVGNQVNHLETRPNANDGTRLDIAFVGTAGNNVISQYLGGGELQGLLDFRNNNMSQAQSMVGLMALTLSSQFNAQHQSGMDMQGNTGGQFFSTPAFNVIPNTANQGTTAPAVSITDVTNIRASDYRLKYDGTQWNLTRMSDNSTVSGNGVLTLDGMSVDTSSGVPVAGDSFNFNPARDAAAGFQVQLKDPRLIAAASPVRMIAAAGNAGQAAVNNLQVTDSTLMPLASPLTISFDANALGAGVPGFVLSGAVTGTLAYDPATEAAGKDFTVAGLGISFHVNGIPAQADTFTVSANTGGTSDNTNALALADLQNSKLINGKQDTLQSFYGSLVASVGVNQQQADSNHTVESALLTQATSYRDSVSGVSLDEEAANMLQFQQSYQAAAQMIKIADSIFTTLLNSLN